METNPQKLREIRLNQQRKTYEQVHQRSLRNLQASGRKPETIKPGDYSLGRER